MSEPRCHYCGEPLSPEDLANKLYVWQAVWGWENTAGIRASGQRGGSDIYLRRRFDRFAHATCVKLEKAGVSARQGALV